MEMELQHLISVARDWQAKMAKSKLSQNDAMFSLRQVIYRKLAYPLLTMTFSAAQCQAIMSPILSHGLPVAGVVQSFPRVLAHSPLTYGSLDLPNLPTEQMIAHILQVLSSSTSDDTTVFLLCICGEHMQLEAGLIGELFQIPLLLCDLITDSWLKHMWQTLHHLDIILHLQFPDITIPCQGNIELMRLFLQHGFHTPTELSILNRCRMFLHAFWLSDICNGSGERIEAHVWTHMQPLNSPWTWPRQSPPHRAIGDCGKARSPNVCTYPRLFTFLIHWVRGNSPVHHQDGFLSQNWTGCG